MPGSHARLSPSSASRWLSCTPSVAFAEELGLISETSKAAEEGTIAHSVAEDEVRKLFAKLNGESYQEQKVGDETGEMRDHGEDYALFIKEALDELASADDGVEYFLEEQVDLTAYVPNGFGTADCYMHNSEVLHVIDYKYGKGVKVSAVGNKQMRLYALGIFDELTTIYGLDLERIKMSIFQPRIGNFSTDEISAEELLAFGEEVKVKAKEAEEGKGKFISGEHCVFCPAKQRCKQYAIDLFDLEDLTLKEQNELTADEVGLFLERATKLSTYANALKEDMTARALKGEAIKGYKLVEGRGRRVYADEESISETLQEQGLEADLYAPRKLLGITDMERLLGKKQCTALLGNYIEKKEGKPTLVPEDDKRQAINASDVFFQ